MWSLLRFWISARISVICLGSRPDGRLVQSPSTSGLPHSACASPDALPVALAQVAEHPPVPHFREPRVSHDASRTWPGISATADTFFSCAAKCRNSSTVISSYSGGMLRHITECVVWPGRGIQQRILPVDQHAAGLVGARQPVTILRSVVLPAPFWPSKPSTRPFFGAVRLTSRSASTPPVAFAIRPVPQPKRRIPPVDMVSILFNYSRQSA